MMKEWGDPLFCLYYEVNEIGRKQKVEKRKAGAGGRFVLPAHRGERLHRLPHEKIKEIQRKLADSA